MDTYTQNTKWLLRMAPFRQLSLSAAYLTPFFISHGLSLTQVFAVQSVFSVALLLWELPSGYFADRFGRALSIKVSGPIATVALTAYGFCHSFWQFVACELLLAVANGLISGVDTALLYDSLLASGEQDQFASLQSRMKALGFASVAVGVVVAAPLVYFFGVSAAVIADGLLTGVAAVCSFGLVEAPRFSPPQEQARTKAFHAVVDLARSASARWLVVLGTALSAATYFGFWLSGPYYQSLGIPVALFGALLAVRNACKAWLTSRYKHQRQVQRNLLMYSLLAGLVFVAMATRSVWLLWAVLGHDIVHALQDQPISARLNQEIAPAFRATLNSLINMIERLVFSVAGLGVGALVDARGLRVGFLTLAVCCCLPALAAVWRLQQLHTFRSTERR